MMTLRALSLAFVLVACGGAEPRSTGDSAASAPEPAKEPAPPTGAQPGHDEHHGLPPTLVAFHDILAPRWHAEPGPARTKDTCQTVPEFETRAAAVKAAAPPTGVDQAAWSDAGAALEKTTSDLAKTCKAGDEARFETAFSAVHDAFHAAMELLGGHHGVGEGRGQSGHKQ